MSMNDLIQFNLLNWIKYEHTPTTKHHYWTPWCWQRGVLSMLLLSLHYVEVLSPKELFLILLGRYFAV